MTAVVDALAMEGSACVQHDEQIHAITLDGKFIFFLDALPSTRPHAWSGTSPADTPSRSCLSSQCSQSYLPRLYYYYHHPLLTHTSHPHCSFLFHPFSLSSGSLSLAPPLCCTFAPASNLLQLILQHRPYTAHGFKLPSHHHSAYVYLLFSAILWFSLDGSRWATPRNHHAALDIITLSEAWQNKCYYIKSGNKWTVQLCHEQIKGQCHQLKHRWRSEKPPGKDTICEGCRDWLTGCRVRKVADSGQKCVTGCS